MTVENAYPTVHAHRYFTTPVHLVSVFSFYMKCVNEGTFAYSNVRKRATDRLTAAVKCVVDLSQKKTRLETAPVAQWYMQSAIRSTV
jgi:hypothetical protein